MMTVMVKSIVALTGTMFDKSSSSSDVVGPANIYIGYTVMVCITAVTMVSSCYYKYWKNAAVFSKAQCPVRVHCSTQGMVTCFHSTPEHDGRATLEYVVKLRVTTPPTLFTLQQHNPGL